VIPRTLKVLAWLRPESDRMRQLAPISLRLALLVSAVALEPVASRAAEFKIGETPCSDRFTIKVIEPTGDIVSGGGNRLTTPFGANFKCGDHVGDCDPQSAPISPIRKGLPQGWARDSMRRDAQITSTGTKFGLKPIRTARNPDWWKSRSEREPNG
jgi:hypothetical protein